MMLACLFVYFTRSCKLSLQRSLGHDAFIFKHLDILYKATFTCTLNERARPGCICDFSVVTAARLIPIFCFLIANITPRWIWIIKLIMDFNNETLIKVCFPPWETKCIHFKRSPFINGAKPKNAPKRQLAAPRSHGGKYTLPLFKKKSRLFRLPAWPSKSRVHCSFFLAYDKSIYYLTFHSYHFELKRKEKLP